MQQGGEGLSGVLPEAEGVADTGAPEADLGGESDDIGAESVRDTVEREFERLKTEAEAQGAGREGGEPPPAGEKPAEKVVRGKKGKAAKAEAAPAAGQAPGFQIPAPNRLRAEEKEAFHAMPEPLKRAVHGMFRAHEAEFTQAMQRTVARERESQHVVEAVRPYLLAHPELSEQGFTESRLVGALVAAHQRLTDPKTQRQALAELAQQQGLGDNIVQAIIGSGQGGAPDISTHPEIAALRERVARAESYQQQVQQQQFNGAVSGIVSEMEQVRNEMDATGRYLYPELHDADFLEGCKPLVSALVRALPGISYGEAFKRAYHTLKGQYGNSLQGIQTRLPANNQQTERAQQAAVSVRGRSAPMNGGTSTWIDEIPIEDLGDARRTTQLALENLRRGVR
jgi:hypothetical protein